MPRVVGERVGEVDERVGLAIRSPLKAPWPSPMSALSLPRCGGERVALGLEVVGHDDEGLVVGSTLGLEGLGQRLARVGERGRVDQHLRLADASHGVGVEDERGADDVLVGESPGARSPADWARTSTG